MTRSGPKRWHAVVQRSDGSIEDPSKRAGMGMAVSGLIGSGVLPLMYAPSNVVGGAYIIRPQIALRPVRGAYQARADLPWYWREHLQDAPTPTDYAMTALHTAPVASTALTGAIDGVIELGECAGFASEEDLYKLSAVSDACAGCSKRELRDVYGDDVGEQAFDVVGSFWSSLKSIASPVVSLARQAVPFIPGVGPIASKAIDVVLPPGTAAAAAAPGAAPGQTGHGYTCTYF